ncbi:DUF4190 domain-containing protein [Nocardia sp. CDC153]|uniref:DUF4190 domain-containing protein n=1 Tax=Nocardia sp. CDC153 TaxID=3112167 RepID=UPI002DB7B07C|nr:DUF4190 domain-containing protein [Nocardia sp. CDC153]MEC3951894.1 DUF4190 domain-containing protein [Nocardia sp. CDC153]
MSTPPNEPGTPHESGTPHGKDDAEPLDLSKKDDDATAADHPAPADSTPFPPLTPPAYPPGGGYAAPPGGAHQPYPQGSPPPYPQQFGPGDQQYGQPYGQPYQPYPGGAEYGAPPPRSGSQVFSIIGFVCAGLALLLCPILGIVGIVLGVVGNNKGEPLGKWAAIAAGVCMIIGIGIGLAVVGSSR